MKYLYTFLLCILCFAAFSQNYAVNTIRFKIDSVLRSKVGNTACQYFHGDYFYNYLTKNDKLKYHSLSGKMIKGKFAGCNAQLSFNYPQLPGVVGFTSFETDSNFRVIKGQNLNFIPEFLLKGVECNYISTEKALAIADSLKFKKGIKPMDGFLDYNLFNLGKQYYWIITNYLTEDTDRFGNHYGKCEEFIVDPVTAVVYKHYNSEYGPLY